MILSTIPVSVAILSVYKRLNFILVTGFCNAKSFTSKVFYVFQLSRRNIHPVDVRNTITINPTPLLESPSGQDIPNG